MERLLYASIFGGIVAYVSYKTVTAKIVFDRVAIACALVIFMFFIFRQNTEEPFTTVVANTTNTTNTANTTSTTNVIARYREDLEDIEKISNSLVFYTTMFNNLSTSELLTTPGEWKNVAKSTSTKGFKFTFDPTDQKTFNNFEGRTNLQFSKTLTGPLAENVLTSNDISKFTLAIVIKHSFPQDMADKEYIIFDFPTSSTGKSGLQISVLNISPNGQSTGADLKAEFRIRYADIIYKLNPTSVGTDSKLGINTESIYLYTFVINTEVFSTSSVVKMYRAVLGLDNPSNVEIGLQRILPATISTAPSFHPSNDPKGITINSTGATPTLETLQVGTTHPVRSSTTTTLYNIAIFKTNLSQQNITAILAHMNHNIKPIPKGCPYTDEICYSDECNAIDNWAIPTALRDLPACRKKIDVFCTSNTSFSECKCWDPNSTEYASVKCRLWRAYIGDDASRSLDIPSLTQTQINEIKNVHKLVTQASQEQAVKDAKEASERIRLAAVDSEKLRLINYYENAPKPGTGMAPDPTVVNSKGSLSAGKSEEELKKLKGNGELDVVDFWDPPSGSKASTETKQSKTSKVKSRSINLVNPYENSSETDTVKDEDTDDEATIAINKIRRLRETKESEEEEEPKGFFAVFRRFIAG